MEWSEDSGYSRGSLLCARFAPRAYHPQLQLSTLFRARFTHASPRRDTVFVDGSLSIPHHGYVNGGLLAAHYWFSGDISLVSISKIFDEGLNDPNAIIVTVGDENIILDKSRAAFDYSVLNCVSSFPESSKVIKCTGVGKFRALKVYSDGPQNLDVTVRDPTSGSVTSYNFPHYSKKSSFVDVFPQQDGWVVYGGYAFVVREGSGENGRGGKDGRLERSVRSIMPTSITNNPFRARFAHRRGDDRRQGSHCCCGFRSSGLG